MTVSPAAMPTSAIDCWRSRLFIVASRALALAFWVLAMAQTAPLSLALATFRPVVTRFWTLSSSRLVAAKLWAATMAP